MISKDVTPTLQIRLLLLAIEKSAFVKLANGGERKGRAITRSASFQYRYVRQRLAT
jgi:hypothetical protein